MGQLIFPESIGKLIKSSTTAFYLEPSIVNIGGQQIKTLSNTSLTPSVSATQLYYVYAYINSGTLALTTSVNAPAVMGASYRHIGYIETNASSQIEFCYQGDPYTAIRRQYAITSSGNNSWTHQGGTAIITKTSGDWYADIHVWGTQSNVSSGIVTIDNFKFKQIASGSYMPVSLSSDWLSGANIIIGYLYNTGSSGRIDWWCGVTIPRMGITISTPLTEKPPFVANGL